MNKEETDLIIAEQNKSTEEILKAVAKVKADYHELCKLKDMRIAELEKENAELKSDNGEWEITSDKWKKVYELTDNQLTKAKEIIKDLLNLPFANNEEVFADVNSHLDRAEQFLSEVEK